MEIKSIYKRKNRQTILFLILLAVLAFVPTLISPAFRKVFTDYILIEQNTDWLALLLVLMLATATLSALIAWIQKTCLSRISTKKEVIDTNNRVSELLCIKTQQNDYTSINSKKIQNELGFFINLFYSIFYFIMMLRLDRVMTFFTVSLIVLDVVLARLLRFKRNDAPDTLREKDEKACIYNLTGIYAVKANCLEAWALGHFLDYKTNLLSAEKGREYKNILKPLRHLSELIFKNLLLLFASFRIMNREFSIGAYLAFQAYALFIFSPLKEVLNERIIKNTANLFRKLFFKRNKDNFLTDYKESFDKEKTLNEQEIEVENQNGGSVQLKEVSLLKDGKPIIDNFSLSLKAGQRVAILGDKSSKSAILELLQGINKPDKGKVLIDGIDIAKINTQKIAGLVGCAMSKPKFFNGSIEQNIAMWNKDVSKARIRLATSDAYAYEEIMKAGKTYESQITNGGANLTVEERYKIEIARAILHNPPLLIIDSAASFISSKSRKSICQSIIRRGCVCITSDIFFEPNEYDEIIFLGYDGAIMERGTHNQLLALDGKYCLFYDKIKSQ